MQVDNKQILSFKYGTCAKSKLRGMISRRWNFIKELLDENITVEKVDTRKNLADILTKSLDNVEFNRQKEQILSRARSLGGNRD